VLSLPFHRRHVRCTTWVTLLAWGLALAAGVANACQLQPHEPEASASASRAHASASAEGLHATRTLHVEIGHHQSHAEDDGAPADAGKAGCLKFCDDESSAVVKGKTAQVALAGAAIVSRVEWRPVTPKATVASRRSAARPPSQGPPLVMRLLRLTI
jgi:hypothetical protein